MTKSTEWIARFVLIILSLLFTILLLEISFRLFFPQLDCQEFGQFDEHVGAILKPNYDDLCIALGHETVTRVNLNSLGLRDREYEISKPQGTFRILVLGDSNTFGIGVEQEKVFTEILERSINENEQITRPVEVINAGVPGYGTAQELLFYETKLKVLEPDVVILAFSVVNDVLDNLCFDGNPRRPCFRLEGGELKFENPKLPAENGSQNKFSLPGFSINRLHIYWFLQTRLENLASSQPILVRILYGFGINLTHESPLLQSWYTSSIAKDGWEITSALLERFKKSVEDEGTKFIIIILPGRPQTSTGYQELLEILHGNSPEGRLFLENPKRPQKMVVEWGDRYGVAVIDTLEDLINASEEFSLNLKDGHFNDNGNLIIGQKLFNWLMAQNILINY